MEVSDGSYASHGTLKDFEILEVATSMGRSPSRGHYEDLDKEAYILVILCTSSVDREARTSVQCEVSASYFAIMVGNVASLHSRENEQDDFSNVIHQACVSSDQ
ncbi:unnamed protein product [Ranitomeya imitator]|uniref:Uncharacterized protein n=1 Tax=Ranitomeya imitator TaxID=111125 RepID=A0ABN9MFV5_9NEOB|nr:unnamed protein product [Ranitomeya imitator]